MGKEQARGFGGGLRAVSVAALAVAASLAQAQDAREASAGPQYTFSNTVRYGAAFRTRGQSPALTGNPNADDGDRNFNKGLISNRLELLSEFDAVLRPGTGARISGQAWYDTVYNHGNDNPGFAGGAVPNQRSVPYNEFTRTTRRLHGRDVQLRDAFVFHKFDAGGKPVTVRLGQHALVWGESLFFAGNAIAGAQSPFDIARLQADPTAQAKEFVLPVPQISGQVQITPSTTIGAYYQFRWRPNRFPAVGSYYSVSDIFGPGAENLWVGPGISVPRGADLEPRNGGQGGLQLRFGAWDTDFGLYAVRFHDKTPQMVTQIGLGGFGPQPTGFYQAYHEGTTAFGGSASRTFGNANFAMEASVRRNQALASSGGTADPSRLLSVITGFPVPPNDNRDNPAYAVGNTAHVNLSTIWSLQPTPLWREALFVGEIAWNRMLSCEKHCTATPGGPPSLDPNGSRDAWGLRFVFTPTYRQVVSGLDVSVPIGVGYAPRGSRSLALGPGVLPPERGGDFTLGLAAVYHNSWNINLAYTHFFGRADTLLSSDPTRAAAPPFTYGQTLRDRDFIAFTVRRSF
ncbi:MAG: hypothetical protein JWP41_2137 [Ramlibacter sp.]|nr:hypothetical protein [Ramlibacter sp.]